MRQPTWILSLILVIAGSWPATIQHSRGNQLTAGVGNMAVVVNGGAERSISVLDTATNTVQGTFLEGQLGTVGTILVDVVVTPDGNTAIVSNFTDRSLFFIDLSTMPPALLGSLMLPIFPIDLALSPDGRFVLVTSGGGSTMVVSVDVVNRTVISNLTLRSDGQAQAVAVASNGLALVADFAGAQVHVLQLAANGTLTQPQTQGPIPVAGRPNNITIAPNGQTVVVSIATTPDGMMNSDAVTILRIDGMRVTRTGTVTGLPGFQQGAAFTPDGSRVLVLAMVPRPDQLVVLRVDGPGMVSDTGQRVSLLTDMGSFFGIDVVAGAASENKAYLGNSGFNPAGVIPRVTVIDLTRTPPVVQGTIPGPGLLPFGITFAGA